MVRFLPQGSNVVSVSVESHDDSTKTHHSCTTGFSFGAATLYIVYCGHWKSYQGSRFVAQQLRWQQSTILIRQKYSTVKNYFVHRRCRSMDGDELIKTKPVEVGIHVVRHGVPFRSCWAQLTASVGRLLPQPNPSETWANPSTHVSMPTSAEARITSPRCLQRQRICQKTIG